MTREDLARWAAWLALATVAWAILMGLVGRSIGRPPSGLPHGFDSPIIAMELAMSLDELNAIVKGDPEVIRYARAHLLPDFVFPFFYGSLFILFGLLLRGKDCVCRRLGALLVAAGVACILFDLAENLCLWRALDQSAAFASLMHKASLAKWEAVGISAILASMLFWPRFPVNQGWKVASIVCSLAYFGAGATALAGVFVYPLAIERSMDPLPLAYLVQLFLLYRHRAELLNS